VKGTQYVKLVCLITRLVTLSAILTAESVDVAGIGHLLFVGTNDISFMT
jgi:hypothetical protein